MKDEISLKEHFEKILDEKDQAYEQRFKAQETAIDKAEANRDNAINKAENSIEKRSDAVYVKVTDLEKSLAAVMLRPEIEGRFGAIEEKLGKVEKGQTESTSRGAGLHAGWIYLLGLGSLIGVILGIISFFK